MLELRADGAFVESKEKHEQYWCGCLCWADSGGGCFGSSSPSLLGFAGYELLGEAQLRESGTEGAEHMMRLCQNRKKASFARVPNGSFQKWRSTLLLFLLTVSDMSLKILFVCFF